jgi:hypothetical protein
MSVVPNSLWHPVGCARWSAAGTCSTSPSDSPSRGFQEEERRLGAAIETAREQAAVGQLKERMKSDLELRFEEVARILTDLDIDTVWKSADDQERRILIEELLEWLTVFPNHLEVKVTATPPLNVLFSEVGLMGSDFDGVGGPTSTSSDLRLSRWHSQ